MMQPLRWVWNTEKTKMAAVILDDRFQVGVDKGPPAPPGWWRFKVRYVGEQGLRSFVGVVRTVAEARAGAEKKLAELLSELGIGKGRS